MFLGVIVLAGVEKLNRIMCAETAADIGQKDEGLFF